MENGGDLSSFPFRFEFCAKEICGVYQLQRAYTTKHNAMHCTLCFLDVSQVPLGVMGMFLSDPKMVFWKCDSFNFVGDFKVKKKWLIVSSLVSSEHFVSFFGYLISSLPPPSFLPASPPYLPAFSLFCIPLPNRFSVFGISLLLKLFQICLCQ